jgi:hypothetical protein
MASSGRYAAAHANLNGPGDARPTALQIIKDEGLEGNFPDKVFLVTGCSSGIGPETARALSATGNSYNKALIGKNKFNVHKRCNRILYCSGP